MTSPESEEEKARKEKAHIEWQQARDEAWEQQESRIEEQMDKICT